MSYAYSETMPDQLPVTQKQIVFARKLAMQNQVTLPWEVQQDRQALSRWIDTQAKATPSQDLRPTSKQVAFAERIARAKRRDVPDECYKSRDLMSRWITSNKH